MENKVFREYRFKFYLNATHYLTFDNKQGDIHPHTWEFASDILVERKGILEFGTFEKEIENCFKQYQNKVLNHEKPFDSIIPSLENLVEYFGKQIRVIVKRLGGELIRIEGSETPTRSYIINFMDGEERNEDLEEFTQKTVSNVIDSLLDDILDTEKK
ncbi:MAG: 6-carboxytetrahydropterin synthase [Lachnospiraceae bacterium]